VGRGGHREGSGRKSGWKHSETQTIRVPKIFAAQLLEYARQLDSGSELVQDEHGLNSEPSLEPEDGIENQISPEFAEVPGQMSLFEGIDSETESKVVPLRGDQLAERFRVNRGVPSQAKARCKDDPEKFLAWTRRHDPDGIAWEFDAQTRLYYPLQVK
jgi:hypothetical protein